MEGGDHGLDAATDRDLVLARNHEGDLLIAGSTLALAETAHAEAGHGALALEAAHLLIVFHGLYAYPGSPMDRIKVGHLSRASAVDR